MLRKSKKFINYSNYEYCVVCFKRLRVKKETPIQQREFYVEGAGQLCERCYRRIYKREN